MRKDILPRKIYSPFLSCSKDIEMVLKALFVSSNFYSDCLKRLLIINNPDCLYKNDEYKTVIDKFSLARMIKEGYIRQDPKIYRGQHENIKSYILISQDNFLPNRASSHFRDYDLNFDIICYNDAWTLHDYQIRPLMICGLIDGILNSLTDPQGQLYRDFQSLIKLTGIGEYSFQGCKEVILNEDISMYSLSYRGVHFSEDIGN